MMQKIRRYLPVLGAMLQADLAQFKTVFWGKLIDRFIWVSTYIALMAYIMPSFGLSRDFGPFLLGGLVCSIGLLETYSSSAALVADLEGDRTITYFLTLPIPSWLVFVRLICYYAFHYAVLAILIIPVGNCMLPEPIRFVNVSWPRLAFIFILINLFHGSLVVWMASMIKNMATLGKMWSRVLHPAWFLGGFQFSWQVLHALWPKVAYVMLLNPVFYSMEGMRAALLGQEGFLPYWVCCVALSISIVLFSWLAIKRFRKRLDFV